jgi:nardilysin
MAPPTASRGPDLNPTKSQLDPKLYRQILLPNGLRCVLIQDTIAMHQSGGVTDYYHEDESIESFSSDEDEEKDKEEEKNTNDKDDDDDKDGNDDDDTGLRDAAVAILVGAGSMYDPPTCQGLAHFLEHLLFMGSTKYPGENEYEAFVAKHCGSDNAYTEWEYTVYSLEIPQEFLWPASFGAILCFSVPPIEHL